MSNNFVCIATTFRSDSTHSSSTMKLSEIIVWRKFLHSVLRVVANRNFVVKSDSDSNDLVVAASEYVPMNIGGVSLFASGTYRIRINDKCEALFSFY